MVRLPMLACVLLLATTAAQAEDAVSFDRPGIPFAPSALPRGGMAWEQSLPDVEIDRVQHTIERRYAASSLLRLGLGARTELQLSSDAQVWRHDTGAAAQRGHSGGDSALGVKVALPTRDPRLSWAVLGQLSLPTGREDVGEGASVRMLATTLQWTLPDERAITVYADASASAGTHSWTVAANCTVVSGDHFTAYLEAAGGHGELGTRGAGGGVAWMLGEHVQLDVSLLRGIGDDAPDWQGGIGVSAGFL